MTRFLSLSQARSALFLAAAALVTVGALAGGSSAAGSSTFTIQLLDTGPNPQLLTVTIGDSVNFANAGIQNHDILIPTYNYTGPLLKPGQSTSLQMNTLGKFPFTETGFARPHRGTINVVATTSTADPLTLGAGAAVVQYGSHATLRGHTLMPPGTRLVLLAHAGNRPPKKCVSKGGASPQAGWAPVGTPASVSTAGTFSFVVAPTIATAYRAATTDGKLCSLPVTMQVRPVVTMHASTVRTKTGNPVRISATVRPAAAATSLMLMSYRRSSGAWQRVATVSTTQAGTAHFTFVAAQGATRLRVSTSAKGIRAAYLSANSPSIVVVGVGAPPVTPSKHTKKHHTTKKKH